MAEIMMHRFIKQLGGLHLISENLQSSLVKKYSIDKQDLPLGNFGMCSNTIIHAIEHTAHYQRVWRSPRPITMKRAEFERIIHENEQRLMRIAQVMFVFCLSSTEYIANCAVEKHQNIGLTYNPKATLINIIQQSRKEKFIEVEAENLWDGAIFIRNRLVHNNGNSTKDDEWVFSEKLTVSVYKDTMMKGNVLQFIELTDWLLHSFAEWSDAFLERALN